MAITVDELEIQIEASSSQAADQINRLAAALENLRVKIKGGSGIGTVAKQLDTLATAAKQIDDSAVGKIRNIVNGAMELNKLSSVKISASISNQLNALNQAIGKVQWTDGDKIETLANGLRSLSELGKSNLTSFINQLRKLPEVINQLDSADLDKFAKQMERVTAAMGPLASAMNSVSAGFARFPQNIKNVISANNALAKSNVHAGKTFKLLNFGALIARGKALGDFLGRFIEQSNAYVENLNLFTVAMGNYAESAKAYAEEVADVMGIDPSQWMRNQGVFMTLATGFGVTADRAALMSKNLTQLGYDLSSFFNITVEDAMQKVQSGFGGELEPLRRLGYDLSQAKLEAVALSLGIDQSVSSMTQAEKAQLRYYAMLTQVTTAQGDMARTLEAPSNQLRILRASATQAARALGNVLIPALNAVLPYAIAFIEVITYAANALANFLGFKLPTVDYSGIGDVTAGVGDLEDALDDASGAASKLKGQLAGFDEITIIGQKSGGGTGGGASLGDGFDFELPEYDFLGDAVRGKVEQIFDDLKKYAEPVIDFLKENLNTIIEMAVGVGAAFAAWKISSSLLGVLEKIVNYFKKGNEELTGWEKASRIITGTLLITLGANWSYEAGYEIGKGTAAIMDYVRAVLGAVAAGVGGALIASAIGISSGVGFVLGITIGVAFLIQGLMDGSEASSVISTFTEVVTDGKIPVEEYATALANAISSISEVAGEVAQIGKAMETQQGKIDAANTSLKTYFGIWEATGEVTAEQIAAIAEQMDLLIEALSEKGALAAKALNKTLIAAMEGATAEAKATYEGLLRINYLLESNMNATLADLKMELDATKTQMSDLNKQLDDGKITNDEYNKRLDNLMNTYSEIWHKIYGFNTETNTTVDELKTLSATINDLSFKGMLTDSETATQALQNLADLTIKAAEDVENAYKTKLSSIEELTKYVDVNSVEWQMVYQEAISLGLDTSKIDVSNIEGVKDFLKGFYTEMYESQMTEIESLWTNGVDTIVGAANDAILEAAKQTSEMQYLDKATQSSLIVNAIGMGKGFTYENLSASDQQRVNENVSNIRQRAIEEAIKHLEKDENWGDFLPTLENMLASVTAKVNLSSVGPNIAEPLTESIGESLTNPASKAYIDKGYGHLAAYVEDAYKSPFEINSPSKLMIPAGEGLTEGIAEGLIDREAERYITDSMETLSGVLQDKFVDATQDVFKDEVSDMMSDIAEAIKNSTRYTTSAFEDMLNEMLRRTESFSERVASAMNDTVRSMANSMASVQISSSGSVSYDRVRATSVRLFASGGYPPEGQMFIAREAGPELVGQIGSRTAVANNDQIVEGITAGVYSANAEQNALLRRQNELLLALLEKETTVTLGKPSAEFGRFASRSMQKYSTVKG